MKNDNTKAIVVLFAFCLVITLALAACNLITAPIIKANNERAQTESVAGLIEGADFKVVDKSTLGELPETIVNVFKDDNGKGIAITFATTSSYSQGDMQYAIGITNDGKISAIREISYMETKSYENYPQSFIGKSADEIDSVSAFSGVTYSSDAFKSALKDVFKTAKLLGINVGDIPENEGINTSEAVSGLIDGADFEAVADLSGFPETIKEAYKDKNGNGVALIFATKTDYTVSDDMKYAVGITSDGKISGIKELSYSESKDYGDDFVNSFVGKGGDEISSVADFSGVTYSSKAFKGGLKDCFASAKLLGVEVKDEVIDESNKYFEYANGLIEGANLVKVEDLKNLPETITSVYRDTRGNGIVVTFAISSRPGSIPMEYAVALSFDGKIIKTREIVYSEGYNINGYPLDFIGKNEQEVADMPHYTGVTSSSSTFKQGMLDTFRALEAVKIKDVFDLIEGGKFEEVDRSTLKDLPDTITAVYRDLHRKGIVVTFEISSRPESTPMKYAVALSFDGKIIATNRIAYAEGYDFGDYPSDFVGKNEQEVADMPHYSGVTSSSNTFKKGMQDTFKALAAVKLLDVSNVIVEAELKEVTGLENLPETVTSVYEDVNGKGIVVTFAVSTYPGREPMQYAVGLSLDGKIIDVKEIVFAEYFPFGDYPDSYIGKNEAEVGDADTLSGVTSSSQYFKDAMKDTFNALEAYKGAN